MADAVLVLTTVADDEHAERLPRLLIEERLAACVNVYPSMISIYHWKGRIERDAERQVVIKTTRARLEKLERRLKESHPYELPEFLVLNTDGGSDAYLNWVDEETR
ncbi:MAG: divalent-cation tolerance protein CutA [Blastocatellia bacterium]|nr:MAG: divalent-cation tolerance protein CutA [Blastocatellia bacterium]